MNNDNIISEIAAKNDPAFGFVASHGGSIDLVGASNDKAASAANDILASLSTKALNVAVEASLAGGVAAAASYAALGDLSPGAVGVALMAGAFSSVSKGTGRKA